MTIDKIFSEALGLVLKPISGLGSYFLFVEQAIKRSFNPKIKWFLLLRQLEFVGNNSFGIVIISAAMIGAAFGIILSDIFQQFGAQSMLAATAGAGFSKELAPLFCGFLVTARAGSAMCAEISTMKVNEQVDAMRVMAVNPYNYLVSPRIIASILMMPLLTGIYILVGVSVALLMGQMFFDIDIGTNMQRMAFIVKPGHIIDGMTKATIFGFILSSVGCYFGFNASGGAKGVGQATTQAVVYSLVSILMANFLLTYIQFEPIL
jgi:phospholipid/cholesterol/gamma-HCH transport system permease protein